MSTFTYHHTRTRARSRSRERTPPPLPRRPSLKRQRLFPSDSDSEYDDYPYSGAHRPSRALVRTTPSQLERWNIWSSPDRSARHDSGTEEATAERRRRRVSFRDAEDVDDDEIAFRLRVARLRERERGELLSPLPPRWSADLFRRERCVSEEFEVRERARSQSRERRRREGLWGGEGDEVVERVFDDETVVRYRRVKRTRTRTDERRPLAGFRRM